MNLPEYNPDDKVWQRIEAKLNDEDKAKVLAKMPEYEPDEAVWNHIAAQLKPAKFFYLKWLAAASLLIVSSLYFFRNTNEIQFSKQEIEQGFLNKTVAKSQISYAEIKKVCQQEKIVCEKPEFRVLESELEDLNSASVALQEAIGKYNTEPELLGQLAEIESQKAEVIKKMADQI